MIGDVAVENPHHDGHNQRPDAVGDDGTPLEENPLAPAVVNDPGTTDFEVLHADLAVRGEIRKAPNPLRAAKPERLERYRAGINRVIAARRAGLDA